jgi:Flp pilus assembly protein CpaB
MLPGEPVTPVKLVKAGEGGVLAAILPQGMRAISTRIKEETGVGGLILPNDHVDVILTRGQRGRDEQDSDVIFRDVRVLAIGQLIEARDGKKLAEGNTATLELTPAQARHLAWANAVGETSLALRSIADIDSARDLATKAGSRRSKFCALARASTLMASTESSYSSKPAGKKVGYHAGYGVGRSACTLACGDSIC